MTFDGRLVRVLVDVVLGDVRGSIAVQDVLADQLQVLIAGQAEVRAVADRSRR